MAVISTAATAVFVVTATTAVFVVTATTTAVFVVTATTAVFVVTTSRAMIDPGVICLARTRVIPATINVICTVVVVVNPTHVITTTHPIACLYVTASFVARAFVSRYVAGVFIRRIGHYQLLWNVFADCRSTCGRMQRFSEAFGNGWALSVRPRLFR
jgi:hypothetical protein